MPDEFDIFSSHDRETESFECTTPKANKRQRKYRIHQVAKDFELRTKDIIDILTRNNVPVKNHMQILNRHELDIIFNTLISRSTNSISNSQKEPCAIYQSEQQFCEAQQMNKTTIIKDASARIDAEAYRRRMDLTDVEIQAGITHIGDSAFHNCQYLRKISIPDSVIYLGRGVFKSCRNLENVQLSKNITTINESTFRNCCSLSNIIIPEGIVEIKSKSFMGCSSLKEIHLPTTLRSIGEGVFNRCEGLKHIYIEPGIKRLNLNCLGLRMGNGLVLHLPVTVDEIIKIGDDLYPSLQIAAIENSFAYNWAMENGIRCFKDDTSPLERTTSEEIVHNELSEKDSWIQKAISLFKAAQFENAYSIYNEYIERYGADVGVYNKMVQCIRQGKLEHSIGKILEKIVFSESTYKGSDEKYIKRLYEYYREIDDETAIQHLFSIFPRAIEFCQLSYSTIKALNFLGKYDAALLALSDLKMLGLVTEDEYYSTRLSILGNLCPSDAIVLAQSMLDEQEKSHCIDQTTVDKYVKLCKETGNYDDAIQRLLRVRNAVKYKATQLHYSLELLELYIVSGHIDAAKQEYNEIKPVVLKAVTSSATGISAKAANYFYSKLANIKPVLFEAEMPVPEVSAAFENSETDDITGFTDEDQSNSYIAVPSHNEAVEIKDEKPIDDKPGSASANQNSPKSFETGERNHHSTLWVNYLRNANKASKAIKKCFNLYQGEESTIADNKVLFASTLILIKHKFATVFGTRHFEVTDYELFCENFPVYEIWCFNEEEIDEVCCLLTKLEWLMLQFNPLTNKTSYRVGNNLSNLLCQKTNFLIGNREVSYTAVDPITKELTFFGLSVFLSTFLDKDEKQAFVFTLLGGDIAYKKVLDKQLFSLIPSSKQELLFSRDNHIKKSFDFLFNYNVLARFIIETERHAVENSDILSPTQANANATPFKNTIYSYFSYSENVVDGVLSIYMECRNGSCVGDSTQSGELFSPKWLIAKMILCAEKANAVDAKFFMKLIQNTCDFLFTYKYYFILRDVSKLDYSKSHADSIHRFKKSIVHYLRMMMRTIWL